jgi:translation initiation factor 2 alpha subunit (eIF-2alpha)
MRSYDENGVEIINDIMKDIAAVDKEKLSVHFLGSGGFKSIITAPDYEQAEEVYAKIESILESKTKGNETSYKLARI